MIKNGFLSLNLSPLVFAHFLTFRFGKTLDRARAGINLLTSDNMFSDIVFMY